jgi:hypothetical protein
MFRERERDTEQQAMSTNTRVTIFKFYKRTRILGRTNHTRTTEKPKKLRGDTQTHRQQGDLISLLKKLGEITDRKQDEIVSLLVFFRYKESRLKFQLLLGFERSTNSKTQ